MHQEHNQDDDPFRFIKRQMRIETIEKSAHEDPKWLTERH